MNGKEMTPGGLPRTVTALAVINFMCAALHFAFEFFLYKEQGVYREFLLIENLLIGSVFFMFAVGLILVDEKARALLLDAQLAWWVLFSISVIGFWDAVTTLSMFKTWMKMPVSESTMLLATGVACVCLCLFARWGKRFGRSPADLSWNSTAK